MQHGGVAIDHLIHRIVSSIQDGFHFCKVHKKLISFFYGMEEDCHILFSITDFHVRRHSGPENNLDCIVGKI